jgi:hypothetical protein
VEARDDVVVGEIDLAELGRRLSDGDGRLGAVLAVSLEQRAEVDVDELVAVIAKTSPPSVRKPAAKRIAPPRPSRSGSPAQASSTPSPVRSTSKSASWPAKQLTITRLTPALRRRPICHATSGLPPTGTSDFGRPPAASPSRSAFPPARTIASIRRSRRRGRCPRR